MDDRGGLTGEDGAARILVRRFPSAPDLAALASAVEGDLVWLDSSLPDGSPPEARERARWSVLAWTDGPFAARFRHEDRRAHLTVAPASVGWFGPDRVAERPAFEVLAELFERTPALSEPVPGCGFALGWVGFLGYELGRESGGVDRTADGHADADLRFVDRAVVADAAGNAWAFVLVADRDAAASAANRAWLSTVTACTAAAVVVDAAPRLPTGRADDVTDGAGPGPRLQVGGVDDASGAARPAPRLQAAAGRVARDAYEAAVEACRAEIRDGNAFQVCLTTAFGVPTSGQGPHRRSRDDVSAADRPRRWQEARRASVTDPHLDEYLRLRVADPVPFGAYLRLGPLRVASRSPERFLRIDAAGTVAAEPIKGTRRRMDDPQADRAVRAALTASAKDRAENVMIVDLLRNDLLRTAVPGSVRVERLCAVETYASVHQMVSTISAVVPAGTSRADVVRAAFPPGSMTGAPKISAMAIADRLEGAPRGVYAGVLGYCSASGAVDLSVAIRTLVTVVDEATGAVRSRSFGAGGAVTWSSVAADEADEVETKTRSVLGGVGAVATW